MLGKDKYRLLYQTELEEEAEWLRRSAASKTDSVEILLNRNKIKPKTIIELGCGIGAVITECKRRRLAKNYIGVDYAPEAIDYLKKHSVDIEFIQGDITDNDFRISDTCEVVLISHVLEHLEEPAKFLMAMKNSLKFSYAIIEVPIEDLIAGKIKSVLKDRTSNKAGHVQFFTFRSFEHLLNSNGYRIIDRRSYVPILDMETIRFICNKDKLSRPRYLLKVLVNKYILRILNPLWKRFYYAHHAVLCVVDY